VLLERDLAVKVLLSELTSEKSFVERFAREARSVARLDHPNIVRVSECGVTDDGVMYLVMELLQGEELSRLLGTPLPPGEAAQLFRQLLAALEHADAKGVVHRDLKPANVFVTRDETGAPVLKLVDFGLAKLATPSAGGMQTLAGMGMGTPGYMSPEQALGGEVDGRTDLYSAGVLFYEMLAGAPPFRAETFQELVGLLVTADPPPLDARVPEPLARIVMRLLGKTRAERYASATEVLEALDACEAPAAVVSPSPISSSSLDDIVHEVAPPPVRPRKRRVQVRRGSGASPPLWIAALLVAVMAGWIFWPDGGAAARIAMLRSRAQAFAAALGWDGASGSESRPAAR
jgi:serine/threonine protein kinase